MKFLQPVRPDELIILEAALIGNLGGLVQFDVRATVAEITVAEGSLMLNRTANR
jgi:3-hydroxymyristoyl/3-hydroxydecanoyl-(acyl carrier protein) dehydratase